MRMHNPTHPGLVLREYLGDMAARDALAAEVGRLSNPRLPTGASTF